MRTAGSARRQEFEGGPGEIAIHGVQNLAGDPGTAVSHGCIRLADADIRWLAARISPGAPLTIRAADHQDLKTEPCRLDK